MTVRLTPTRSPATVLARYGMVLVAVWWVATLTSWGRRHDQAAYRGRHDAGTALHQLDALALGSVTLAAAVAAVVAAALVVGRRRRALRPLVAVAAALATAEVLKALLPHPAAAGWSFGGGSFPSGHTTMAAALSLAALRGAPMSWRRRLVGPLTAWTVLAATATITLGWHRPSDVVGGLVVALSWHHELHGAPRTAIAASLRHRATRALGRQRDLAAWWASVSLLVLLTAVKAPSWQESTEAGSRSYLAALAVVACACAWVIAGGRAVPARLSTEQATSWPPS